LRPLARAAANWIAFCRDYYEAVVSAPPTTERTDLAIFDNRFPVIHNNRLSGRRTVENVFFLKSARISTRVFCPPGYGKYFGCSSRRDLFERIAIAASQDPSLNVESIRYFNPNARINATLAYVVFQTVAKVLVPYFEKHRIRFVFTIYPGGGFAMPTGKAENKYRPSIRRSDEQLKYLFGSPMFERVFVHHTIIYNYLVESGLCQPAKIAFLRGLFADIRKEEVMPRKYFGFDKKRLDICFVAHRYTKSGADKGYDVFVNTARTLGDLDVHFHVVGDWNERVTDVAALQGKITFYGILSTEELIEFFVDKDIILSPTRAHHQYYGQFDGFPLVINAGICGVAMFVTDPMGQNEDFAPGSNIEIITRDKNKISDKVRYYYRNPDKLMNLAKSGQEILFDIRDQDVFLKTKESAIREIIDRLASSAPAP
jgi:glycosyl transferase family 1